MREIEIKLELEAGADASLLHAPLGGKESSREELLALYFDTPDCELAEKRMSLRLRREGERWVQTFKSGGSGTGGLHSRDEWEEPAGGPVLDLAAFESTPLADLPDSHTLHERLIEVFRVGVLRLTWELEINGSAVQVALDRGEVRGGDCASPIFELEIESKGGNPDAVFDLARELVARVPMRPSAVTKAARGYRLLRREALAPVKALAALKLDPSWSPAESARHCVASAMEQLQGNEEGVLASDDPEFVHQLRVALRRVRSALRAHRKALEPGFEEGVRDELKWITGVAGTARDLDVLSQETLPAMARDGAEADGPFEQRVEARRRAARARLREALRSSRYALLMLTLARWLGLPSAHAPAGRVKLARFGGTAVGKNHRTLLDGAKGFADLEPAQRHEVRIAGKRLRYAVQGFESLFPEQKVASYLATLSALQDDLGAANDATVAMSLIESLDPPPTLAHFARGWLAARTEAALQPVAKHLTALKKAPAFWKK